MDATSVERLLGDLRSRAVLSGKAPENLGRWLSDPSLAELEAEIVTLVDAENWDELQDAFRDRLKVGTGGIRGRLGVGPNRVNMRTIGEAAQGLCRFIIEGESYGQPFMERGIVVGHEARKFSRQFAEMCCEVFAANGIKSFLFEDLRSTPEISFAVRHLKAAAGVQITASHNPRTDNGFKFYWEHGGQVVPPEDAVYMQYVNEVTGIDRKPLQDAIRAGEVTIIGSLVDEAYLAQIATLSLVDSRSADIVFSPIHGAGSRNVLPVLRGAGFKVNVVEKQWGQNPEFPTAEGDLINPEFVEVMKLPMALAESTSADVALCSDPDADRIGVAAKVSADDSSIRFLSGNQIGIALTDFILARRREKGSLSADSLVLETFVTSSLIAEIARSYGIKAEDQLLVGYKFIAQVIDRLENAEDFVFSAEESLGYLAGNFVRDKDAAIAALLVAEMVSWLKDRGQTLVGYLDSIYERFGYFVNVQYLVEMPGEIGLDIMGDIMDHFRHQRVDSLADVAVAGKRDFYDEIDRPAGVAYRLGSSTDMISLALSKDWRSRVTMRPSGTEPKLKYYIQHFVPVASDLAAVRHQADLFVHQVIDSIVQASTRAVRPGLQQAWTTAVAQKSRSVPTWDSAVGLFR